MLMAFCWSSSKPSLLLQQILRVRLAKKRITSRTGFKAMLSADRIESDSRSDPIVCLNPMKVQIKRDPV